VKLPRFVRQVGKRVVKVTPILRRHILSSTDYRTLSGPAEAEKLLASSSGWLANRTVERQERAYQRLLLDMNRGDPRLDFKVAAEALIATGISNPTILEIGCGSGYYSEVFKALVPGGIRYTGSDYSAAMIERARKHYPSVSFKVADATKLPYADDQFDVVFNGVSLMHILDYAAAIREAARVAKHYCVFHSVPIFQDHETIYLHKLAYGSPVIEVVFGKAELMSLCESARLHLAREWAGLNYDLYEETGHHSTTETYLFEVNGTNSG